jgi:hypothetical protein
MQIKVKKFKLSRHRHIGDKEERSYTSYSFLTSALNAESGQRYAPAALYSQEKDPRYKLRRNLVGPQKFSGHRGYR